MSGANFLRGYGGIRYLADALSDWGIDVELYAPIPRGLMAELNGSRFPIVSMFGSWSGQIPRLRVYLFKLRILAAALKKEKALLFSELNYFRQAVAAKKARPQAIFIHYCQELLTPEEFPDIPETRFYEQHADVPDLILDVEPHRAAVRKARFNLTHEVLVLPNTLPASEVPPPAPAGTLARLAGGGLPSDVPILVYAGGTHKGTGFQTILAALETLSRPLFFLSFCHGLNVEQLRLEVATRLGSQRGRICHAVPRKALLSCLHEASAGLVYYPYSDYPSTNQLYCAPSKVYEYIATGLPVIASANPPLIDLVEGRQFGVCARDDSVEALQSAIRCLLANDTALSEIRERERCIFRDELCFEKASAPVVSRIGNLLASR